MMLSDELQLVNNHIRRILIEQCDNPEIIEIMDWLLQNNGKQLRPKLTILSSQFCKKPKDVTEYAACIEIVHMASLVHDDVIDNSDLRRGRLSVQKKFGKEMAIYSGDYMIFALASNTIIKPKYRHKKYIKLINNICLGELSQHSNLHNTNICVEQYLNNIEGKTASLFQTACLVGANEGGCSAKRVELLSEFGKNLGMIFQLKDDLLDYFSTRDQEGKNINCDIISGVYALPLIFTLCGENGLETKKAIENYRNNPSERNRLNIMNQIKYSNGFEYTYNTIQNYKLKCDKCLDALPDILPKMELKEILDYVSILPNAKFYN